MEMPFDILNQRLGNIRDNGDIDFDNTAAALDIDQDLQARFVFFPIEELDAVHIDVDWGSNLSTGDGPEQCNANHGENPDWLYNHAVNALALWRRLKHDAEKAEQEQAEAAKLAKRPLPGVYQCYTGAVHLTLMVTDDRRVMLQMNQGGLRDATADWDERCHKVWRLQRIDVTDGTISA